MGVAPIVIMAFSRPDYLVQVLESLLAQRGCAIEARDILLFQDGETNAFSGRRHGGPDQIAASLAAFRRMVPGGYAQPCAHNLGVALNFDRAERFVFEQRGDAVAIFLEDDMVLSPHYIATLDQLLAVHEGDERIGYVAAYGDHALSLAEQERDPSLLATMHHNWAFGLYRRQWLRMRSCVQQYLDLVRDVDYRQRDEVAIGDLHARWGFGRRASSQDAAKTMACLRSGAIKLKTRACLGRYIGERGIHMTPAVFEQRGFAKTELYPEPITRFEPVTDALYRRTRDELLRWAGSADRAVTPSAERTPRRPPPAPHAPPAAC